ncbi:type I-B CRISPR-associated endonuclease Cas1b [Pseudothermotoga thermarum]|uniref:CRISPR-associated endonuclease Cas1 n=1 Tax=Pseudothermotoga thermarum DSM 5069 TaxID=688269 RepID=F7YTL3_9THEM|nr:type I-B CRISPR-associated endonuclease Cas1b [Pseudothermotoga thermarum]AEH51235.1 CRISPR-associated protein, Cas1 family [Pseudothermotoga thermarum DSM 5069]
MAKKTLYIFASGRLQRKDNTICAETEEGKKYFPVESVRDIFIMGEVDLNKKFLEFLEEKEIVAHFFGYYGNYVGTFYPREHNNSGYMIVKQVEHYLNPSLRLKLARKFVEGSLENMLQVLKYYEKRKKNLEEYCEKVSSLLRTLENCNSIEELMAIEGNARRCYYESFNVILEDTPFSLAKREKRPATDPINALISYGNSLVYMKLLTEIYMTHLDPRIGYLHTTNFRSFTLNLDVAEIFKPILADRTLFSILGKRMIDEEGFEYKGEMCILKEKTAKKYVQEFEEKLSTTLYHRELKRNISYQNLMRMELYKLEKHLMGEKEYEPFVSRW